MAPHSTTAVLQWGDYRDLKRKRYRREKDQLITKFFEYILSENVKNSAEALRLSMLNIASKEEYKPPSLPETYLNTNGNSYKIFIYGSISAGTPLEAIQNSEGHLNVPIDMIKNNNQHYALKVSGESMINAGILDGDIAILEKTNDVVNGDIVVALIDGQEATLKRFRKKTNSIALEPANKKFETRIFGLGRVLIQGKLVGLIRNY